MEYRDTLNLPKTKFKMKANLTQKEPQYLKRWDKEKLYQKLQEAAAEKPLFILHDGPPYANGNIHLGTAFNKVLKDIILKSRRLAGFQAPYIPGWDCHGLPIEIKVDGLSRRGTRGLGDSICFKSKLRRSQVLLCLRVPATMPPQACRAGRSGRTGRKTGNSAPSKPSSTS